MDISNENTGNNCIDSSHSHPFFNSEILSNSTCIDEKKTKNSLLDLYDSDLMNFSEWISPTIEERAMRLDVIHRVGNAIKIVLPESKIEVYGSFESDLCVPQSDIDIVIFNPNGIKDDLRVSTLSNIALTLHKQNISKTMPSVISMTKVPIIKFVDRKTNCMVDINIECESGTKNTSLMKEYLDKHKYLRPLALILKYYLKLCYLNDAWTGGIGSYTLLVLIISYLQNIRLINDQTNSQGVHLSIMLVEFLEFYGKKFNYTKNVVSVYNPSLTKEEKNWYNKKFPDALSVEDPDDPNNDIGRASFNIEKVKIAFQKGYETLSIFIESKSMESFVSRLVHIPHDELSYRSFIKKLYEKGMHKEDDFKFLWNCSYHPNSTKNRKSKKLTEKRKTFSIGNSKEEFNRFNESNNKKRDKPIFHSSNLMFKGSHNNSLLNEKFHSRETVHVKTTEN